MVAGARAAGAGAGAALPGGDNDIGAFGSGCGAAFGATRRVDESDGDASTGAADATCVPVAPVLSGAAARGGAEGVAAAAGGTAAVAAAMIGLLSLPFC